MSWFRPGPDNQGMNTTGIQGSPTARRLPSWLGTGVAGGLSVAIVMAFLAAAITLPSNALLGKRPDANVLAYANSGPGAFNPLDDGFVRGRLGGLFPTAADARRPLASTRLPRTAPTGKRTALPPVVKQAPLSNDDFSSAYPIEAVPFRGETKTSGASRESSEPSSCLPAGGTVWYRYTAPSAMTVFANTFGSGYALTLGAFEGDNISNLRQVACTTSTSGNASATFAVAAGRTYFFQLTGPVAGGHLLFTLVDQGVTYQASATKAAGKNNSFWSILSADGRYLTFISVEPEYAPRPALCRPPEAVCRSLMWRDLVTGRMKRLVSVRKSTDRNDPSYYNTVNLSSVSADGSIVAFDGRTGVTPDKRSRTRDVFTVDTRTGVIRRISSSWRGGDAHVSPNPLQPVNSASPVGFYGGVFGAAAPSISADGRFVAFMSDYDDLYPGQAPSTYNQIFVKDLRTGSVRTVSVNQSGAPANGDSYGSYGHYVSADGRFVAFDSNADDLPGLIPSLGCTPQLRSRGNCARQVYLADAKRGTVTHVSRSTIGVSSGTSELASISADGNHVVYASSDDRLVADDTNQATDVFIWNRSTGKTSLVSVDSDGIHGAGDPAPTLKNAAGAVLTACSLACGYVEPVFQVTYDVGTLTGLRPVPTVFGELYAAYNGGDPMPTTSADGRYVAFSTEAALAADDTNGERDVYVHDAVSGATVRVSIGPGGEQGNSDSFFPFISDDGTTIGFTSAASNLVSHDTNGSLWSVFVAPLNWTE